MDLIKNSAGGGSGVLSATEIAELLKNGFVKNSSKDEIGPSSLDIRVADDVYELKAIVLPPSVDDVYTFFKSNNLIAKKLNKNKKILERGKTYLVKFQEILELPENIRAIFSPKSSIGRVDVHVRIINPHKGRLDVLEPGYKGELWAFVTPRSFNIMLASGVSLTQIRFIKGDPRLRQVEDVMNFLAENKCFFTPEGKLIAPDTLVRSDYDNAITFTLDLGPDIVGWQAIESKDPLDLTVPAGTYNPSDFFKLVSKSDLQEGKFLLLQKDRFYILTTYEYVVVPAAWSLEFAAIDPYTGEFRGHYAGFVDPGWGVINNNKGKPITLEVRPFEDVYVVAGQPIIKAFWDKLSKPAEVLYDKRENSHYIDQPAARLSKYFKTS